MILSRYEELVQQSGFTELKTTAVGRGEKKFAERFSSRKPTGKDRKCA